LFCKYSWLSRNNGLPILALLLTLSLPFSKALGTDETQVSLPIILKLSDVEDYKRIFELQKDGHWDKANKLIKGLDDTILMGHVLAQRYLHPTKYRSEYKELKQWMSHYADHPYANRLYKLALRRKPFNWRAPERPVQIFQRNSIKPKKSNLPRSKSLSRAQYRKVSAYKRQIKSYLRKGWTKSVKRLMTTKEVNRLFSDFDLDQAKASLALGYFSAGRDEWAVMWASQAAERSGRYLPEANWTAGLASWRLGHLTKSAHFFESAAITKGMSDWITSASAFWAARAYLVSGKPEKVNQMLGIAAAYPRTFYGLLARKMLDLPITFLWSPHELEQIKLDTLVKVPGAARAFALLQVGEVHRAERDLRSLAMRSSQKIRLEILTLAARTNLASLAVRLNYSLYPGGGGFDGAAYPLPTWKPKGGYSVDKALVFALIRQESAFNPKAKSWAGARGLMQLMPRTAGFVAGDWRFHLTDSTLRTLYEPEINMMLGQKYIKMLLENKKINGNLFLMAAAWNGGPGNLNKWRRNTNHMDDPLFFIESIPSRETRVFIEKVLTNLWIYRDRLGQPKPSLDAIAAGQWPVYKAFDNTPARLAENGSYNGN
jgi:soluble lytic murein transglycosylase-like protein